MITLGRGFVSVVVCEVRPLHAMVISRNKCGDSSTGEIAALGTNKESYTISVADEDIRSQRVRYSAVEPTSQLMFEPRVRKAAAHIKAGRLGSFEKGHSIDLSATAPPAPLDLGVRSRAAAVGGEVVRDIRWVDRMHARPNCRERA
jgi:hypothetical protein